MLADWYLILATTKQLLKLNDSIHYVGQAGISTAKLAAFGGA